MRSSKKSLVSAAGTIPAVVALLTGLARKAGAEVIDTSMASELIGGTFSVTFGIQTSATSFLVIPMDAPILAGPTPDSVRAVSGGTFEWETEVYQWGYELNVAGDTSISPWTLTHTGTDGRLFILGAQTWTWAERKGAAFDAGTDPSTPGSGPGTPFAITVSGPAVINTGFDPAYLWNNPENTGDLYTYALVQWAELSQHDLFGPGMTAQWILDTDTVPSPGAAVVAAGVAGFAASRRRRPRPA